MNENQGPRSSSTFNLQTLGYFPHYFSDEEREALIQWGAHAAGLTDGSIAPVSVKEIQFVEVVRGHSPPATRFQRAWLRYLQGPKRASFLSPGAAS